MEVLNNIKLEPYGYSHGDVIGFKMNGVPRGFAIDFQQIDDILLKRKGNHKYNTTRSEQEAMKVHSGFTDNITNGQQIWIEIAQHNFKKKDYQFGIVRPGHADLSAYQKYGENWNYSGGGQFSGRLTILYVIAGEIARQILTNITDIQVLGHVSQVGSIKDAVPTYASLQQVQSDSFPMVDVNQKQQALQQLTEIKKAGDSIGGKVNIYVSQLNRNYGDDFFGSLESKISFLLYSIPAVKAVEFGIGVDFSTKRGSEVVESLRVVDGKVISDTNYNGGINGGIANLSGPINISVTFKPTSTIFHQIQTVQYNGHEFEPATLQMTGRHDAFIANRGLWAAIGLINILFLDMELSYVK